MSKLPPGLAKYMANKKKGATSSKATKKTKKGA